MSASSHGSSRKIHLIQIYRAAAAIAVLFYHVAATLHAERGDAGIGFLFSWGFSGVHLFFVLSGFVICLIHYADLGKPERIGVYVRNRFARIYPIYWFVMLVTVLFTFPIESPVHVRHLVENVTLFRITGFDKIVPVAWSLSHEILFYVMFMGLILSRVAGFSLVAGWLLILAYRLVTGESPPVPYTLSTLTGVDYGAFTSFMGLMSAPINLLFAFGALAFFGYCKLLTSTHRDELSQLAFVVGLSGFAAGGCAWLLEERYMNWGAYNAVFGISSLFMMVASASTKLNDWASSRRALQFLGNASYSIYLAHFGVQQALVGAVSTLFGPTTAFVLISALSLLAGITLHVLVEQPALRWLGRAR